MGDATPAVINHIGLCTPDLDRAIAFYTAVFGFELDRRLPLPDEAVDTFLQVERPVGLTAAYLYLGDVVLELIWFDRPGNPPGTTRVINEPGLTHLSFSVDDVEATASAVEANGGTVVSGSAHARMVRDPDGQLLELLPRAYRERVDADRATRRADDTP